MDAKSGQALWGGTSVGSGIHLGLPQMDRDPPPESAPLASRPCPRGSPDPQFLDPQAVVGVLTQKRRDGRKAWFL